MAPFQIPLLALVTAGVPAKLTPEASAKAAQTWNESCASCHGHEGRGSALSAKVRDGELKVVQAFSFADHKTKQAMNALATLEAGRTVLVVDNSGDRNLALGVRNLKGVTLMPTRDVNPYHLLGHKSVLLSEAAARKFSEALAK